MTAQVARNQLLNTWSDRLAASLQNLAGVKPSLQWTGNTQGMGDSAVFWLEFEIMPGTRIHVGAPEASWRAIAAQVIRSNPSIEAYLDARQIYVNLLEQSSERKGVLSNRVPPCAHFDLLEMRFPGQAAIQLILGLRDETTPKTGSVFGALSDVEMPITVRFGSTRMLLQDLAGLDLGSAIEFNRGTDEAVDILVNGRLVAHGEPVVIRGNYGIRITEVVSREQRINTTQRIQKETK